MKRFKKKKDKYGAIRPHIGVVTARDWSCGLIDHIILKEMLHVRFALRRAAVERVAAAFFFFFSSSYFRPRRDANSSCCRCIICTCVWFGDQFPMGTTYSLFNTRNGRTSPSSKTHHTGLWNVLLTRPSVHLSSCMSRGNPTCRSIFDICRSVPTGVTSLLLFCCFSTSANQHPVQVWKDKKSPTAFLPDAPGHPPHCGPTSWPSLAKVWLVVR